MNQSAVDVRRMLLPALALLVSGTVHSAGLNDDSRGFRQEPLGALQTQQQVMTGLGAELRSGHGAAITTISSPSERASALHGKEPARGPDAAFELDLWTVLAGSLGWMIFVAMRRL